jgi:mono/diheme cytochrome c family protein
MPMQRNYASPFWAATTVLGAVLLGAGLSSTAGLKIASAAKPNLIAQGQALTAKDHCTGCHGADLKGVPKMGPSLRTTGALKHYTIVTFERALHNGVDEKGKPLHPPMPTFHMAKGQADAIYAYLKTLK